MPYKRTFVVAIGAVALIAIAASFLWPSQPEQGIDQMALEADELLQQYTTQRIDGSWPQPSLIQTQLLTFSRTSIASDGARVDHYEVVDSSDQRRVEVQLYPDGHLCRVEISPAT